MGREPIVWVVGELVQPRVEQILEFCAGSDRACFLEDVARRGLGRFAATAQDGRLTGLCHLGANVVPAGSECGRFAKRSTGSARMIIGEERASR